MSLSLRIFSCLKLGIEAGSLNSDIMYFHTEKNRKCMLLYTLSCLHWHVNFFDVKMLLNCNIYFNVMDIFSYKKILSIKEEAKFCFC